MKKFVVGGGIAAAAFAVVACSSIQGTPEPGEADLRVLDTGRYPTSPLETLSNQGPIAYARLEAARMADAVLSPHEIESKYTVGASAQVHTDVRSLTEYLPEALQPTIQKFNFIVGFSTGSADSDLPLTKAMHGTHEREGLTVTVLRFPDRDAARSAAAEMDSVDFALNPANAPVELPGYPGTHAHWRPSVPTLGATTAHGIYVISTLADARTPDLSLLVANTQKYLDAELPELDKFIPTPLDRFHELRQDPDGILVRALHDDGIVPGPDGVGEVVFTLRGYLNYVQDQSGRLPVMERAGVDRVAVTSSVFVFRTRDERSAERFVRESSELGNPADRRAIDPPEGLPRAACLQSYLAEQQSQFRCFVSYGRFAALILGHRMWETQQRAAAQYALFVNSG